MAVPIELCRAVPKVALHDHLDGGLRPATIVEEAAAAGYPLPTDDPAALGQWFFDAADSGSLVRYLETFTHTIAVMQTAAQLRRVAREFVEDQAVDGVVYAEARWAPEQHLAGGLSLREAVEAVRDGLAEGMAACAAAGRPILARQILTSMRHATPTTGIAELAVAYRNDSVCGFDIAGAEDGFPPSRFGAAFDYLKRHNLEFTIHAGEAFGLPSIWEAVQLCGASRLGHGVRLVEDIAPDGTLGDARRLRPGPPDRAGGVPVVQPPDRHLRLDRRAPVRAARPAPVPGDGQLRQPADEPHHAQPGVRPAERGVRLRSGRPAPVQHQRRQERLPALPGATGADRPDHGRIRRGRAQRLTRTAV